MSCPTTSLGPTLWPIFWARSTRRRGLPDGSCLDLACHGPRHPSAEATAARPGGISRQWMPAWWATTRGGGGRCALEAFLGRVRVRLGPPLHMEVDASAPWQPPSIVAKAGTAHSCTWRSAPCGPSRLELYPPRAVAADAGGWAAKEAQGRRSSGAWQGSGSRGGAGWLELLACRRLGR